MVWAIFVQGIFWYGIFCHGSFWYGIFCPDTFFPNIYRTFTEIASQAFFHGLDAWNCMISIFGVWRSTGDTLKYPGAENNGMFSNRFQFILQQRNQTSGIAFIVGSFMRIWSFNFINGKGFFVHRSSFVTKRRLNLSRRFWIFHRNGFRGMPFFLSIMVSTPSPIKASLFGIN